MSIDHFVSGAAPAAADWLSSLLPAWPETLARQFVETYTHADAVVLDPFAVSEVPIREALAAGRRVIATNSNPLVVLMLRQRLSPPEPGVLKTALTRLGDNLKRGVPLREHLNQLYRTRCLACRHQVVADFFVWSRQPADPRQKWVDCRACGHVGLVEVDERDLAVLDAVETRGLHYWYLLDRVASPAGSIPGDEARAQAETLLELYTPRALYAIADLLMRIEASFDEETQTHLKAALLSCLDAASNRYPPPPDADMERPPGPSPNELPARPQLDRLHPPARFVERNVWRLFEMSVQRLAAYAEQATPLPLRADLHWVTRVSSSPQGLVWVHNLGVGALGRGLAPECVSLLLTSPPRPNPVFWSLTYLWTGWLFGPTEAGKLKNLALQKWPDWSWYQSVMTTALRALRPVFRFDGVCVLAMHGSSPQQASAILMAALAASYDIQSWQHRATGEHQFILIPAPLHAPPPQEPETLRPQVVANSARAAIKFVRARGEPVQTETLNIAAWHRLMRKGIVESALVSLPANRSLGWLNSAISQGLEEAQKAGLLPVTGENDRPLGWWLRKVGRKVASPLSDRVEIAVLAALREAQAGEPLEEMQVVQSIYRRFSGPLTPDAGLVHACLEAYGEVTSPGYWRLHPREQEAVWQEEMKIGTRDLLALGDRLGYHAQQPGTGPDIVWEEDGRPWATFDLVPTASVARFLPHGATSAPRQEIRWRNLVIPAARTGLWQHKLRTYPWLAHMIKTGGWTFIKLENIRPLAARDTLTRHDLKAIVGLVPPVESGGGQLPLF